MIRAFFSDIPEDEMVVYHIFVYESPSGPKWAEKNIPTAGELAGNPQEHRKTGSQTRNVSFSSDSAPS